MSEYSFTYRNDNFNPGQADNATLFIKAGKTALSFLIVQDGQLLAWKDNAPLDELTGEGELKSILSAPYKQVITGLVADALTLVPSDLYSADDVAGYARFLDVKEGEKVFAAKLDAANQIVYKTVATDTFAAQFNVQDAVPADRGWINAIAESEPSNYALYADICDGQVSLLAFNGGQVRFYNTFKATTIDDVLYYCLFTAKQLDLQPDYTQLILSGHTAAGDIDKLGGFFRTVKYNDLKLLDVPQGVASHQLLSLAALA